ncbi:ATP-binding cassette domain-containing protein [Streptacidiphilus albus]|uniref:ATP-binding cassette domain-containing protein n=1 Tax=Streptacidiphilus albus TaxID=105425 RepID=UPI00054B0263|nr:ATP-binding cassette domain-containing protein [Streptacidiphilus albus]
MRLDSVSQRYGLRGPWILRDVSLTVPEGSLVRVQGGNGSGKSTLLRLVAAVCEPTRGRVRERPARRAYVPERFPAALPFTAHGYLCHLGRIHGLRGSEPARRADAALERFGAAAFAHRQLRELSKGTCQKVAVAQALLGEPELLVLDEAWTGLDAGARAALDDAVGERLDAGCTVVFVDHDPARLAGLPNLHWLVGAGRVREPDLARTGPDLPCRIVLSGRPGGAKGLDGLAGVLAVAELGDDRVRLTAAAGSSDDLLRTLLADPAVHVESVR